MQKTSRADSAMVTRRALLVLLVCAAACLVVTRPLPAFLRSEAPANVSQRTLTFAERVAYQRIIEDVYWRHRIWPKERPDSKPSLDAVMTQAQLEKKVTDYLRQSQALEDYWRRPITAEQLQAEMDRMATQTKQPEVLRELLEALGNDPFIIAECLARPALAERLLTSWYGYEQRIHGELKRHAESELAAHPTSDQIKRLDGRYGEIEFVKINKQHEETHGTGEHAVSLSNREWDQTVEMLATLFARGSAATSTRTNGDTHKHAILPIGKLSSLQEDDTRYFVTAVLEKTDSRLRVTTVTWPKESLESFLSRTQKQVSPAPRTSSGKYHLPAISKMGTGCIDNTWTDISGPPDQRAGHSAVWTGTEMIVWGGFYVEPFNDGGRYNPAIDAWSSVSLVNAPDIRIGHSAVWTGNEMIIWGGYFFDDVFGPQYLNTGGRYNPDTNSWVDTNTTNAPVGRTSHTAIWSGAAMIVWGGFGLGELNDGGRYDPDTDSWTSTSMANAPSNRSGHTAVWTGNRMIIWGGYSSGTSNYLNTGGQYNPDTDSWTATSISNAPSGRSRHTTVWTGAEMIVWGGADDNAVFNTGGRYNPLSDTWVPTSTANTPTARSDHTAVWSGSEMIIWSGSDNVVGNTNTGGRYNPGTNSWTTTNVVNAPEARTGHTAVWSDSEMIVWGGFFFDGNQHYLNTGGRYNPLTDSWTSTGVENTPTGRYRHSGVWTGSEMIIWGGRTRDLGFLDTGAKYIPSTDSWTPITMTNVPSGRSYHATVWTGSEMIVWGGFSNSGYFNTGGRYNPGADNWTATSMVNAPAGRELPTAVWTGSEMLVWGGYYYDGNDNYTNTGGRYNPNTNSWTTTNTTNAPFGRASHTAVWTGNRMVVWGGYYADSSSHELNSGGIYDPNTDSWSATSTINAPTARDSHRAVWTGSDMIIWGGFDDVVGYSNTGGRYNPQANSWTGMSSNNAPSGRVGHSSIWTGDEMIIWGGLYYDGDYHSLNTGGRYNPSSNSWSATDIVGAPSPRDLQTAVWTGDEMIVWGGLLFPNIGSATGARYCANSSPTPTPTPCTGRCSPTPRPGPTSSSRPTPPPHITPYPTPSSSRPTPAPRP